VSEVVRQYYNKYARQEWDRLHRPYSRLEFAGCLDQLARLAEEDPVAYENIIVSAADLCEQPQWRDCTEHLHFIVRKPECSE